MTSPWLEKTGLLWLHATEGENDFAEKLLDGSPVQEPVRTLATQARLGYCWSHLAQLFPARTDFRQAAEKSFRFMQYSFTEPEADFRVYDNSFFLLFMAWYYRVTGDPTAIRLLLNRYADIDRHFDDAGVGGFVPQQLGQPAGLRSHNPYMHLLEAMLAAFQTTQDEFWLAQAKRIRQLFTSRLLDRKKRVVFELLNRDWSISGEGRVEIGHQLQWSTLLLQLSEIGGRGNPPGFLIAVAQRPYMFALKYGFDEGLAMDAVNGEGVPMDRRKLLWSQTEAVKHFAVRARILQDETVRTQAMDLWRVIRQRFFHANGWTWYNSLTAEGKPVQEPALARLLYHVVTAAAEIC
jgi:mannose-6-phosphate isomerase